MKVIVLGVVLFFVVVSANEGSISVRNLGGYVAFTVEYDLNGERKTEFSNIIHLFRSEEIKIPSEATNIFLRVVEPWFMPANIAIEIFSRNFTSSVSKCYWAWRYYIYPTYTEVYC